MAFHINQMISNLKCRSTIGKIAHRNRLTDLIRWRQNGDALSKVPLNALQGGFDEMYILRKGS
jgi:hypothetical protein